MNTGVLGGTFDPVHNGHLLVAEEVRARLSLASTLFIPAGQPWLKADSPVSAAKHRAEMVRLALADKPYFKLSTMELKRAGPSYMVDTIAKLQPKLEAGDELFLILGWDSLARLPEWQEPSRLVEMCYLVAVPRPGFPAPNVKAMEALVPGISQRVMLLKKPVIDISASVIRDRVARGLSIHHLVPEAVNRYIKEHGLYTTA